MLKHFANRQVPNIVNKEHIFFAYTALLCFVLTVPFSGRTSQPLRVQWKGGGSIEGGIFVERGGDIGVRMKFFPTNLRNRG